MKGLHSCIANVSVANSDILFWTFTDKNWEIYNISDAYIDFDKILSESTKKSLLEARSPIILGAYKLQRNSSNSSFSDVLLLAKPVLKLQTGEFLGVCYAFVDEKRISHIYSNDVPNNGTHFYLVSEKGIVLSSSDSDMIGYPYSEMINTSDSILGQLATINGTKYIVNKKLLSSYPNMLYGLTPVNSILGDTIDTVILFVLIGLVSLFIALLLSNGISQRVTAPLARLTNVIANIDKGNAHLRADISGDDEIALLSKSFNKLMDNQKVLHDRELQSQKEILSNQFKLYQAQIVPHFLCNSLEAVISLMQLDMKPEAEKMLSELSDFYRLSLSDGADIIPLSQELALTKDYLSIQAYRYTEFFTFDIDVQCDLDGYLIPKLTLQPIVENSIYHGIKPKGSMGKITLTVSENDSFILIRCLDDGVGMSKELVHQLMNQNDSHGFAMTNINRRLKLYYGDNSGLFIESMENEFSQVMVKIPKERANA